MSTPKILDMHGKPLSPSGAGLNNYYNTGLSNGAASLDNPSLMGWDWPGGDADSDLTANNDIVRQRSRDLAVNSPVIAGLINTVVNSVVGQGLIPEPTPDTSLLGMSSEEANTFKRDVMRLWEYFAEEKSCSISGDANFYDLQRLVLRSAIESGDVFVTMPYVERTHSRLSDSSMLDLKVQIIEADCVSNPAMATISEIQGDVFGGVETGIHGEVLAYWVATRHPLAKRYPFMISGQHPHMREWVRIPAVGEESGRRNILHITRNIRPGQRRGVSLLAPVVESVKVLDRYIKAELRSALVQNLFTVAIKSQTPQGTVGAFDALAANMTDDSSYMSAREKFYAENGGIALGSGNVAFLAPDDDITPVSVTHPESGFGSFVEAQLKMIGAGVGVPYEMIVMQFTTAYTASRAAMNMYDQNKKVNRDWIAYDFCQPVYEAFIAECVGAGYIKAPGFFSDPLKRRAYCMSQWNGPGSLSIDGQKELAEYEAAIALGAMTHTAVASEYNGSDYRQNAAVLHEEQKVYDSAPWQRTPTAVGGQEPNNQVEDSNNAN